MIILAIESSCDETAAAVVENGTRILSNVVVSQVDIFAAYGGVIPEVAARSHLEAILPVVHKALDDAGLTKDDIDAIAVTHTPGLMGSLLIGTLTARMLAILWGKPLYATHHLKSHIYANLLRDKSSATILSQSKVNLSKSNPPGEGRDFEQVQPMESSSTISKKWSNCSPSVISQRCNFSGDAGDDCLPEFPLLALVVSGGHTQIIYMSEHNQFEIIGTTRDDAVGECFDKVAKILGLPYPGGPSIAKCAEKGDIRKYKLPHPKVDGLDFSFSGLKTAVLRAVQNELGLPITTPSYELKEHLSEQQKADFAASFQETACEILLEKVAKALEEHPEARSIVLAGGVSANQALKEKAQDGRFGGVKVFIPELKWTGDNAAMVGAAAYFEVVSGVKETDPYSLSIAPRTDIA